MSFLDSIGEALMLIARGDAEVWRVTAVSLQVSVVALLLAVAVGLPTGYAFAIARRPVAAVGSWVLHTLTAVPTVVVGLTLYFAFSAAGPLGWMDLLYTRTAMVVGQFILALPILAAIALTSVRSLPVEAHETAITPGVTGPRRMQLLLGEARSALVSALLVAFARIFTELGAAVILGGNIRGQTRTLTTVIALEYSKGDDARAIAMGVIPLAVALGINGFVHGAGSWRAGGTHVSSAVEAIDVVVGYDATPVADVGSFTVHADRLTVITGPNGSGKTTLLKTLAGLLSPINGRMVPQLLPGAGGVVFVHSTRYLFAGTVRHNVHLSSRGEGRRAADALRTLGVEHLWNKHVRALSTGERQRVAIVRALAAEPRLLVIDEPEGGLDAEGSTSWRRIVEQALSGGHPSIVIATHQLSALEGLFMNVVSLPRDKS